MTFIPPFMAHYDQFCEERKSVQTLEDWKVFSKKWLNNFSWPTKSAATLQEERTRKKGPVSIGGRSWGFTYRNDDISPETRFEYALTVNMFRTLRFPGEESLPKTAEYHFYQECPYCEIWTDEIGDNICPLCGRTLLLGRSAD